MEYTRISSEERSKTNGKDVAILGVGIDSNNKVEVLKQVQESVFKKRKLTIVTPNPEIILEAQEDAVLRNALNAADISIPDGVGILRGYNYLQGKAGIFRWLSCMYAGGGKGDLPLIKGRELTSGLIQLAEKEEWTIILLGNREGSAKAAMEKLRGNNTSLKVYSIEGPNLTKKGEPLTKEDNEVEKNAIEEINKIKPQILLIGFGAPRQEKWMQKYKHVLSANVMMVVGGTFDYISGKTILPPTWWPLWGEWLWRLFTKKGHIKRVWRAVVQFPLKLLFSR